MLNDKQYYGKLTTDKAEDTMVESHCTEGSPRRSLVANNLLSPLLSAEFMDAADYAKRCNVYQRVGRPSTCDEMPFYLFPSNSSAKEGL